MVVYDALRDISGQEREDVMGYLVMAMAFLAIEYQLGGDAENQMGEFTPALSRFWVSWGN